MLVLFVIVVSVISYNAMFPVVFRIVIVLWYHSGKYINQTIGVNVWRCWTLQCSWIIPEIQYGTSALRHNKGPSIKYVTLEKVWQFATGEGVQEHVTSHLFKFFVIHMKREIESDV